MEKILLVGYGGHALSVADSIARSEEYEIIGYTDSVDRKAAIPYLGNDDVLVEMYKSGVTNAVVCVGYLGKGNIRERIYQNLKNIGFNLPVIKDPSAIISENAFIDEGTFVGKNVIVNSRAHVGKMVILNTSSIVEHSDEIGDFSHVAVASVLCGDVKIGRGVLIGANATVIQGRTVDDYTIVPAGSVVR